jgi:putative peptidoglycan lipid II flippase
MVIPGSVGMAVLATPIIAMIYHKGAFGAEAVAWTAATMPCQAIGLLFIASSRISAQALNATKDYRGPALAALVAFACNVALSLLLMGPMGTSGMALANSLAAVAGLAFQAMRLKRTVGGLPVGAVMGGWLKMAAAAALMGLAAWYGNGMLRIHDADHFQGTAATAFRLLPLVAACGSMYFGLAWLFGVQEAKKVVRAAARKLRVAR